MPRFSREANTLLLYCIFRVIKKILGRNNVTAARRKLIASNILCAFWHIPITNFNSQIRSLYYLINSDYRNAYREEFKWLSRNSVSEALDRFIENLEGSRVITDANLRNVYVIAPAIKKEVGMQLLEEASDQDLFILIYQPNNELVEYAVKLSKKNSLKVYLFTNSGYRSTLKKRFCNDVRYFTKYDVIEQSEVRFPQFLLNGELFTGVWSLLFALSAVGRSDATKTIHAYGFDMYSRRDVYSRTLNAKKVADWLDDDTRKLSLALHSPFKNFQIISALRVNHGLVFDQLASQLISEGLASYSKKLEEARSV